MEGNKIKFPQSGKDLAQLEEFLYSYEGEDRIVTSHEIAEKLGETSDSVFKTNTGIPSLDRVLGSVEAGELIIVTGPSGAGKTSFMMSITANMCKQESSSAWFTLEVTPRQFINKMKKIMGDKLPLFYMPAQNTDNNIKWLHDRIIEAKVKYNIKVAFVDHLHQLFSLDKFNGTNLSLEIGDVVAKIKQLAITHNIVIFLVAHSTDAKDAPTREPKMMDIRDSGMISRLADTVLGIWRIANKNDGTKSRLDDIQEDDIRAKVRIWKNRREGKLGFFVMQMLNGHLQEVDTIQEKIARNQVDDDWAN